MANDILIVDDEVDSRKIIAGILQDEGYETREAGSSAEALGAIQSRQPNLIILDVMMPGMDGIETYKRLREIPKLAETPVVFMTAKAMTHEIENYRDMGATDVIAKPFDPTTLADRLREIWDRAHAGAVGGKVAS